MTPVICSTQILIAGDRCIFPSFSAQRPTNTQVLWPYFYMTTVAHLTPSFKALPLPISQLSLAAVLQCGQSFRWSIFPLPPGITGDLPNYEYRLCLHDRVVCLRQTSDTLFYRSVLSSLPLSASEEEIKEAETLTWIQDYFQLDVDLEQLYRQWSSRDRVFEGLQGRFRGIRILRQDPFECLLSYVS